MKVVVLSIGVIILIIAAYFLKDDLLKDEENHPARWLFVAGVCIVFGGANIQPAVRGDAAATMSNWHSRPTADGYSQPTYTALLHRPNQYQGKPVAISGLILAIHEPMGGAKAAKYFVPNSVTIATSGDYGDTIIATIPASNQGAIIGNVVTVKGIYQGTKDSGKPAIISDKITAWLTNPDTTAPATEKVVRSK